VDKGFFTEYFINYARCYDEFNPEHLSQFYFAPTLMVKDGSVVVLSTPEEIFGYLNGLLASYKEHGYKKGNIAGVEIKQLGGWTVAVTVHWIIDHVNGSILRDFYSTYNLFRHDSDWRILVTTNHDG
jgi:NTF2-like protein (DUF6841)